MIKVETKKCQIVTKVNHAKRFIYSGMRKLFNENYDDTIDADETTAELRHCTYKRKIILSSLLIY